MLIAVFLVVMSPFMTIANEWQTITFVSQPPENAVASVPVSWQFEIWHHTGNRWSASELNFTFADNVASDPLQFDNGLLRIPWFDNNWFLKAARDLPSRVDGLSIAYTAGEDPTDIFTENPQVKITSTQIQGRLKPILKISEYEYVNDLTDPNTRFPMPRIDTNYGRNVYSVYSKGTGNKIGNAYALADGSESPIPYEHINSDGTFKSGHTYVLAEGGTVNSANVRIGQNSGIFYNGGAIGYRFDMRVIAHFYEEGNKLNFAATSITGGGSARPGTERNVKVYTRFEGNGTYTVPVILSYRGVEVGRKNITFTSNSSREVDFTFTLPTTLGPGTLRAEINPLPRTVTEILSTGDPYADNVVTTELTIVDNPDPPRSLCWFDFVNVYDEEQVSGTWSYDYCEWVDFGYDDDDGGWVSDWQCVVTQTFTENYYEKIELEVSEPQPAVVAAGRGTYIEVTTRYRNNDPSAWNGSSYSTGVDKAEIIAPITEDWEYYKLHKPVVTEDLILADERIYYEDYREASFSTGCDGGVVTVGYDTPVVEQTWLIPYARFSEDNVWTRHKTKPTDIDNLRIFGGLNRWYYGFDIPDGEEFQLTFNVTTRSGMEVCANEHIEIQGSPYEEFVVRVVDPHNPFPAGVGVNWQGKEHYITGLADWYDEPERAYQAKVEYFRSGGNFKKMFENIANNIQRGLARLRGNDTELEWIE